jgi:hypothetical protein
MRGTIVQQAGRYVTTQRPIYRIQAAAKTSAVKDFYTALQRGAFREQEHLSFHIFAQRRRNPCYICSDPLRLIDLDLRREQLIWRIGCSGFIQSLWR